MSRAPSFPALSRRAGWVLAGGIVAWAWLGACATAPSALEPRGPRAARIAEIWWVMFGAGTIVFLLVLALLLYALFRVRPRPSPAETDGAAPVREPSPGSPDTRFVVAGGVVLPVVVLVPLLAYSLLGLRAQAGPASEPAVNVEVIGHQYWWTVRYLELGFTTANEIRVPVGQPVRLTLGSSDVIHSFWVPQLMGKHDLVPGHTTITWLQADQPGVYWGECAEFCGIQHAKMAFVVVAEPPEQFAAWAERQQAPAVEVADPVARRGAQVFARAGCITCHVIRYGTTATGGEIGPDLTHFGSRLTIAAGILPNNRGNLGGWIANPQAIKPGNNMPISYLDSESLLAVVTYLESLK